MHYILVPSFLNEKSKINTEKLAIFACDLYLKHELLSHKYITYSPKQVHSPGLTSSGVQGS